MLFCPVKDCHLWLHNSKCHLKCRRVVHTTTLAVNDGTKRSFHDPVLFTPQLFTPQSQSDDYTFKWLPQESFAPPPPCRETVFDQLNTWLQREAHAIPAIIFVLPGLKIVKLRLCFLCRQKKIVAKVCNCCFFLRKTQSSDICGCFSMTVTFLCVSFLTSS